MAIWDIPYQDKIIQVEAPENSTKEDLYKLADSQREEFQAQQQQQDTQYEQGKTPLHKAIGETAYGALETARTIGSGIPSNWLGNLYGGFTNEAKGAELRDKLMYQPYSKFAQEALTLDPNNQIMKTLEGIPPTMGGGVSRSPTVKTIGRTKLNASEIPTRSMLKAEATQAYKAADDAGAVIKRDNFKNFNARLKNTLSKEGWDSEITEQNPITIVIKRLEEVSKNRPVRLDELEKYRRMALNATTSTDNTTSKLAGNLIENIDDYMDTLVGSSLVSGSEKAVDALKTARNAWKRQAKLGELEWLAERAQIKKGYQPTNKSEMEILRGEVASMVMNPKRTKMYTATEKEALKDFATGGKLDKTLQAFSGFSPNRPFSAMVTTAPAAAYGGTLGYQIAGPAGAAIGTLLGTTIPIGVGLTSEAALASRTARKFGDLTTDIATNSNPYKYKSGINLNQFDTSSAFPIVPRSLLDVADPNYEDLGYNNPIMSKRMSDYIPK